MVNKEKLKYFLDKSIEEKDIIRPIYNEIFELTDPFTTLKDEGKQELNTTQREVDSDVLDSISALVSYIMSTVLPRGSQWANLDVDELKMREIFGDQAQKSIDEIRTYIGSDVDKVFNYIQNSNYYEEIVRAIKCAVRVGTGAYTIRETGLPSKPFVFQYVGLDNLFITNDNFGNPSIVFKKHPEVNAEYLKDVFGADIKIPQSLDQTKLDSNITIYECVLPDYDEETTLTTYNYIVVTEDLSEVLLEKILEYNPFVVFKLDSIEGSSWGTSIVVEQRGLLKELQEYQNLYKTQAKRIANPPAIFYGNQELFYNLSFEEGVLNYGGNPQLDNFQSNFQILGGNGNLMPLDKLIADCRVRFKKALMVEMLTMSPSDVKYGTASAINISHEMFRRRFANTYELINSELIAPTFLTPFIIMLKYNQLSLTQEVLPYVAVQFVNELSKSSNINDINKIMNYTSYVAQLKQSQSLGVALNLNKTIPYISDKLDIPKDLVPSESDLMAIEEAQRQALQQQMQQQAIAMAQDQGGDMNDANG